MDTTDYGAIALNKFTLQSSFFMRSDSGRKGLAVREKMKTDVGKCEGTKATHLLINSQPRSGTNITNTRSSRCLTSE